MKKIVQSVMNTNDYLLNAEKNDIFCNSNTPGDWTVILGWVILVLLFIGSIYVLLWYWNRRDYFPIRGRGPKIVTFQWILILIHFYLPFFLEIPIMYFNLNRKLNNIVRKQIKTVYQTIRFSIYQLCQHFKTLYVWKIWRGNDSYLFKFKPIRKASEIFISTQCRVLLTILGFMLGFFVILLFIEDFIEISVTILDENMRYSIFWRYWFWEVYYIIDQTVLFSNCIQTKAYPRQFGVFRENVWILVINFIDYFFYIGAFDFSKYWEYSLFNQIYKGCAMFTNNIWLLMLRFVGFAVVSLQSQAIFSSKKFPLPGTYIFDSLSIFFFADKICYMHFSDYIHKNEVEKVIYLYNIQDIFLKDSNIDKEENSIDITNKVSSSKTVLNQSDNDTANNNCDAFSRITDIGLDTIEGNLAMLEQSYQNYKKTISYKTLYKRFKKYEKVTNKNYQLEK